MWRPEKIGHLVLNVNDLAACEAFYTGILGFEVVNRLQKPRAVFLTLGTQHHDLALFEVTGAGARQAFDGGVGLHHFALRLESPAALRQCHAELRGRGIAIVRAVDHGTTHSLYVEDPAGNRIELYCDARADALAFARSRTLTSLDDFPALDLGGGPA